MSVPAIASIYSKDRDDPRAWDDFKLMQLAYELLLKIEEHKSMLLIEAYESGPEWQAALAQRQKALDRAFKAAGLRVSKIPSRDSQRGMEAKRREYIGRYEYRFAAMERELERRGLSVANIRKRISAD
jgi:hypothetical protein